MRRFNPELTYSLIDVSASPTPPVESKVKVIRSCGREFFGYRSKDVITCECGQTMPFSKVNRHLSKCPNRKPDGVLGDKPVYVIR